VHAASFIHLISKHRQLKMAWPTPFLSLFTGQTPDSCSGLDTSYMFAYPARDDLNEISMVSIDPHLFFKIYVIYFDFTYNLDKIDMDIQI